MNGQPTVSRPELPDWLTETEFTTASEFLEALQPSHPDWETDKFGSSRWMFRGHWDAEWELQPPLFRESGIRDKLIDNIIREERDRIEEAVPRNSARITEEKERVLTILKLSCAEKVLIERFRKLADTVGHNVGDKWIGTTPSLRDVDCHPTALTALAQHHGIPTRLLDWSTHPLHAAFFASVEPSGDHQSEQSRLVVWALSLDCVDDCTASAAGQSTSRRLRQPWCPAHRIDYLRVQQGVLVYDDRANQFYQTHGRWPSVRDSIEESTELDKESILLRKMILPRTEIHALREKLMAQRVSYAFLMPTLDNVARTIRLAYELPR